ncbi:MAG: hypothetical protein Q9174_000471 [Haloplaca sp. 1 TL-2023]
MLTTRPRLGFSASNRYHDAQDLATAGLWITRGNGLTISFRIDISLPFREAFRKEDFANGLSKLLSAAKLWSQLSLQASQIQPTFNPNSACSHFLEIAFALTHLDSLETATAKPPSPFGNVANARDIKPPSGVSTGFINFIELDLVLAPLSIPISSPSSKRRTRKVPCQGPRSQRLLARHTQSNESFKDETQQREMKAISSVVSQICNKPTPKFQMLDDDFPILQPAGPIFDAILVEPSRTDRATTQEQASAPRCNEVNPLDFLRLIDASIRQTISGASPVSKRRGSSNSSGPPIKLAEADQTIGLADISPALFRPGYMEAIGHRAPLIPRIASSLSRVHSRSRTLPSSYTSPIPTVENLQPQLWHLLQKRKWPTTSLEPLPCDDMSVFEDHDEDISILDYYEGEYDIAAKSAWTKEDKEWTYEDEEADILFPSLDAELYTTQQTSDDSMMLEQEAEEENLNTFSSNASTLYSTQSFEDESDMMMMEDVERLTEGWRDEDIVLSEGDDDLFSSLESTLCSMQSGLDHGMMMLSDHMEDDEM